LGQRREGELSIEPKEKIGEGGDGNSGGSSGGSSKKRGKSQRKGIRGEKKKSEGGNAELAHH